MHTFTYFYTITKNTGYIDLKFPRNRFYLMNTKILWYYFRKVSYEWNTCIIFSKVFDSLFVFPLFLVCWGENHFSKIKEKQVKPDHFKKAIAYCIIRGKNLTVRTLKPGHMEEVCPIITFSENMRFSSSFACKQTNNIHKLRARSGEVR